MRWLLVVLLCSVSAVRKKNSLRLPEIHLDSTSCNNLPGRWTGFTQSGKPVDDVYELHFDAIGEIMAVMVAGKGWTLGRGYLGKDNETATMMFDDGNGSTVTRHGNVSDECQTFVWDDFSVWRKKSEDIDTVHIVAMNHLDVGYNGIPGLGLINNILNRYFHLYFPRSIALSQALRDLQGPERFIYTTHAWLLHMYMHCPKNFVLSGVLLQCPSKDDVALITAAVKRGDIVWHAGAFNTEYENCYNKDGVDVQFSFAKELAEELGVPAPTVASVRDVPGITRGTVPLLHAAGIKALTIGVNNGSPAPQMPNPGIWHDPASNTSVLYMQTGQGQGYPNNPGTTPDTPGGLGASSCVRFPGLRHVLCWAFRTDNSGPPLSVSEVQTQFDIARFQFPGADVIASTHEAFVTELAKVAHKLPIITKEVGDTWITSTTADPIKMAFYRTAARAYSACIKSDSCDDRDERVRAFTRMLAKFPEHTYGIPGINDDKNYTNKAFSTALNAHEPAIMDAFHTYTEQRDLAMKYGMEYLGDHPLKSTIEKAWAKATPAPPDVSTYTKVDKVDWTRVFTTQVKGHEVQWGLDGRTGGLVYLMRDGVQWADHSNVLGQYEYKTYNTTDFFKMNGTCCWWDNSRQEYSHANSTAVVGEMTYMYADHWPSPRSVVIFLNLPTHQHTYYGAPKTAILNVTVLDTGDLSLDLTLLDCTPTRLGGAHFFHFTPVMKEGFKWDMDKLGTWIDPLNVVAAGSQYQHTVTTGVRYKAPSQSGITIEPIDSGCMNPRTPTAPATVFQQPDAPLVGPIVGFSSQLMQNAFSTNTPLFQWDRHYRFRFIVHFL